MLLQLLVAAAAGGALQTGPVYHGRTGQTAVKPPRVETEIAVDGNLDEAVWADAAVLTGFSQYAPVDGVAASDSTEVLVWYSPTAIHFGIRAYESHGPARATLADRDRITQDDHVQILLGTFDDGRQASVFMVNPLGVQADGSLVERGNSGGNGFNSATITREGTDLSPDFVYESRGRVTPEGYVVEVTIPFKSLRYQSQREQRWGIQVVRRVQHSGFEDTWAPARQANASFLVQGGRLEGLTGLRRGLVLDMNPSLTQRVIGTEGSRGGWDYRSDNLELGGNVRWGITNNLSLNATANPDFSQVESDVGQFAFDPRQAVFFQERRPFFLDGLEQFATPNNLIYTRRIVQPDAAVKLTGKAFGTEIGVLSAVDQGVPSADGSDHPVYNIVRLQRDIGSQSRLGMAYTDRVQGGDWNRMANVDGRVVVGEIWQGRFQLANSWTNGGDETVSAPLWGASIARNGRAFRARYSINAIDEEFRAGSGFIGRPGIVNANLSHSYTVFPAPGGLIENVSAEVRLDGTWQYGKFVRGEGSQDRKLHFNFNGAIKGGWRAGVSALVEEFGYDSTLYADYWIDRPVAGGGRDTVRFTGVPEIPNFDMVFSLNTPQWSNFAATAFLLYGKDENFAEWSSGTLAILNLGADWRPTDKIRVNAQYNLTQVNRRTDGSRVLKQQVPRVRVEYQLNRWIYIRAVGQYAANVQDSLRDDRRTGAPILFCDAVGENCSRAGATRDVGFRGDLLFSFQPNPGTVVFAGYGSSYREPLNSTRLVRTEDGVFLKVSYLFRM